MLSAAYLCLFLAQDLHTERDYLSCSRAGQGVPLGKTQRGQVWQIVQRVVGELKSAGMSTHLQLANEATHIVRQTLAAYKAPRELVLAPIVRAANGKLDYKTVRAEALKALGMPA